MKLVNKILLLANKQQAETQRIQQFAELPECEVLDDASLLKELPIDAHNVILECRQDVWQLSNIGSKAVVYFDFSLPDFRRRLVVNNLNNEYVVRAIQGRKKSAKTLSVLDATAGLGRDAMLLAAAGCKVFMIERIPALALLVEQAIFLAKASDDAILAAAAERMQCCHGNSIEMMQKWALQRPDIVYLDPMYQNASSTPVKGLKPSSAVKKHMASLQQMTSIYRVNYPQQAANDFCSSALIDAALSLATAKVVVKRAPKAPWLGNKKPSSSLNGKAARFDIYAC